MLLGVNISSSRLAIAANSGSLVRAMVTRDSIDGGDAFSDSTSLKTFICEGAEFAEVVTTIFLLAHV